MSPWYPCPRDETEHCGGELFLAVRREVQGEGPFTAGVYLVDVEDSRNHTCVLSADEVDDFIALHSDDASLPPEEA